MRFYVQAINQVHKQNGMNWSHLIPKSTFSSAKYGEIMALMPLTLQYHYLCFVTQIHKKHKY